MSVNGKPWDSKSQTEGSIPSTPARRSILLFLGESKMSRFFKRFLTDQQAEKRYIAAGCDFGDAVSYLFIGEREDFEPLQEPRIAIWLIRGLFLLLCFFFVGCMLPARAAILGPFKLFRIPSLQIAAGMVVVGLAFSALEPNEIIL